MHSTIATAAETVLERFFEAAVAPELWPNALQGLAEACGAEGAAVNAIDGLHTHGTVGSAALLELYRGFVTRWRAPDLNSHRARGLALIRRGWRGALTEQDCFTPEELARDPFHQECFVRSGFSSFAGAILGERTGPDDVGLDQSQAVARRIHARRGRADQQAGRSIARRRRGRGPCRHRIRLAALPIRSARPVIRSRSSAAMAACCT